MDSIVSQNLQQDHLSPPLAEAPVVLGDNAVAVRSAAGAGPGVGSSDQVGESQACLSGEPRASGTSGEEAGDELGDLVYALEEAVRGVELARGDVAMAVWRVDDVERSFRDVGSQTFSSSGSGGGRNNFGLAVWEASRACERAEGALENLLVELRRKASRLRQDGEGLARGTSGEEGAGNE